MTRTSQHRIQSVSRLVSQSVDRFGSRPAVRRPHGLRNLVPAQVGLVPQCIMMLRCDIRGQHQCVVMLRGGLRFEILRPPKSALMLRATLHRTDRFSPTHGLPFRSPCVCAWRALTHIRCQETFGTRSRREEALLTTKPLSERDRGQQRASFDTVTSDKRYHRSFGVLRITELSGMPILLRKTFFLVSHH